MTRRVLAALLVVPLLLTAACGDDDDDSAGTTTTAAGDGEQAAGDFCTGYMELLAGDPSPEQIRAVADQAPEGGREPLEAIAAGFEEQGEDFFESEEFQAAFAEIGRVAGEECADQTIAVTAVEYAFEGMPSEVPAGVVNVEFSNNGNEFHEMVVFRKPEGTTQSFDEIFEMGEEESEGLIEEKGGTFAPPGGEAGGLFQLDQPGEYIAVCFIPVGSTPDAPDGGSGPPHYTQGMRAEFTVS